MSSTKVAELVSWISETLVAFRKGPTPTRVLMFQMFQIGRQCTLLPDTGYRRVSAAGK